MKTRFPSASRVRSGMWGDNKCTNLMPYAPFDSHVDKIAKDHERWIKKESGVYYYAYPTATGFLQPLTLDALKKYISSIPHVFSAELGAVFLVPGSLKMLRTRFQQYGCYYPYYKSIFLYPFPESLRFCYKTKPKPSVCLEYERHGAVWKQEKKNWVLQFSLESLRSFYLRDVLTHEVGHHIEEMVSRGEKSYRDSERFAEWFAFEFGMRNVDRPPTEFGRLLEELIKDSINRG